MEKLEANRLVYIIHNVNTVGQMSSRPTLGTEETVTGRRCNQSEDVKKTCKLKM